MNDEPRLTWSKLWGWFWGWFRWVGLALIALLLLQLVTKSWPFEKSPSHTRLNFPAGGPSEFLYLDNGRVAAYLAQIDGGTFASEQQSGKITEAVEGKVAFQEAVQLGISRGEEHTFSRVVTPTAAAQYFELLFDLEHHPGESELEGVEDIGLGNFAEDVKRLHEGQFVSFQTHGLRPPIYLNPYLAARQRTTMEALFPQAPGERETAEVHLQRVRIHYFRHELGRNPRVTFKVHPLYPKQAEDIVEKREEARAAHPEATGPSESAGEPARQRSRKAAKRRARKCQFARQRRRHGNENKREQARRQQAVYLMPLDARRLTRERSLMKYGGGDFTVVGKVVRVFPEHGDSLHPAYIDSSTRETWEQPLANAPSKLLCRTDPNCRRFARHSTARAEARIEETRCSDLAALRGQTEIPVRGAVILPIAIYK